MDNKSIGEDGEKQAVHHLMEKGYEILEQNYRHGHGEIDVITMKGSFLVFIEVKKRVNAKYGYPEDFVSVNQQRLIMKTARNYIYAIKWKKNIRFDIIAITGNELLHLEDAFY